MQSARLVAQGSLLFALASVAVFARGTTCELMESMGRQESALAVDAATASECRDPGCPYFTQVWEGDAHLREAANRLLDDGARKSAPWFPLRGTEVPVASIRKNGTNYLLMTECEPHSCPNHAFFLLYDPTAQRLTILYVQPRTPHPDVIKRRWLGSPNALERELLTDFSKDRVAGD